MKGQPLAAIVAERTPKMPGIFRAAPGPLFLYKARAVRA
jgi:hypothetical protein